MIIQNSAVCMAATSSYSATATSTYQRTVRPCISFGNTLLAQGDGTDEVEGTYKPAEVQKQTYENASTKVKFQALTWLLRLLFEKGSKGGNLQDMLDEMFANSNSVLVTDSVTYEYTESQAVSFESKGTAVTADGRELEFNVSFSMSASFSASYSQCIQAVQERSMTDPLVVNLDCNPTSISDQKFFFDLDCDGEEEEINQLGPGSGFLALDLNNDGIINDGSELFGPKSKDGFADLAIYDDDHNGWIDEADEIFSKLRIWTMDEQGKSELYTLKQSDIGAIYLGKAKTSFLYNDKEHNAMAMMRNSGIFLRESTGQAGTISHVDMAG